MVSKHMKLFINRNKNLIGIIEYGNGNWIQTSPIKNIIHAEDGIKVHCSGNILFCVDTMNIDVRPFDKEYWIG